MHSQSVRKPTLQPTELDKNNAVEAVAILAGFTVKYQGGNHESQDRAAKLAVSLLNQGLPAVSAIDSAVKSILQGR
jgi:hypothetical protein